MVKQVKQTKKTKKSKKQYAITKFLREQIATIKKILGE